MESNPKLTVGGHTVYGLRTTEGQGNCYRIMKGNGVATGEDPEFIYAVYDSTKWTPWCCYDFGSGGDGSYLGGGVFFEGAITAGGSEDKAVDDAIQANIVAAG